MSCKRANIIRVDIWVDAFDLDGDGLLRIRRARAVTPLAVGDLVCLGDGERVLFAEVEAAEGGVVVLKPSARPGGAPSAPMLVDDGWCDLLD